MAEDLTGRQLHNRLSLPERCGWIDTEGKRCGNVAKVDRNSSNVPEKRCLTHLAARKVRGRTMDKETLGILKSLGMI